MDCCEASAFPELRLASEEDLLPTLCLGLLALMLLSHSTLPSSKIARQQRPQCDHVPRRPGSEMAMATILERADKKAYMDDSVPLKATILTHRALPDHVEFVIKVQRVPKPEDSWEVAHRYNEFSDLNDVIKECGYATLPLPPKKMFGSTERQFLVERQQKLQVFMDALLQESFLSSRYEVKKFLDPSNYTENVYDVALRDVSMFFRSEPTWNVVKPLKDIGSRFRKQYYLIESKTNSSLPNHLLSWVEPGPDFSLGHRELEVSLKTLTEIKHPHILSPLSATFHGTGLLVVRKYVPTGSLRDRICGGPKPNPQLTLLQKCFASTQPKTRFSVADIRKYGRQVLEALQFLQSKGFVLGHIHSGNVIIDEGCCKLVDIENSLLGLVPLNRHFLLDVRKIHTTADELVFMFGHMLYEMTNGDPLKTATIDSCPPHIDLTLSPLLSSLLTPQGIKTGLPTIEALLANDFFSSASPPPPAGTPPPEKPVLKVHSKLKEILVAHAQKAEQRLVAQQKVVAEHKRVSKAKENYVSEDAKTKRRRSQQKQMSLHSTEEEPEAYPTTAMPRQSSLSLSQPPTVTAVKSTQAATSSSSSSSSSSTPTAAKPKAAPSATPPPPTAAPPQPRPQAPPQRPNNDRSSLLSSIEGFGKGKLKKTVTNDRSCPLVSR